MRYPIGAYRLGLLVDSRGIPPDLEQRLLDAYDRADPGATRRQVELWIDDWWELARIASALTTRNPYITDASVRDTRRWGRKVIGRLSALAGLPAYRGYATVGERIEPVFDGWIAEGGGRPWPGRHQIEGPANPVYLVPRLQLWRGKPLTIWYPRPAADQLWRVTGRS